MQAKDLNVRTPATAGTNKSTGYGYYLIGPTGAPVGLVQLTRFGASLSLNGQTLQVSKDILEQLGLSLLSADQYHRS